MVKPDNALDINEFPVCSSEWGSTACTFNSGIAVKLWEEGFDLSTSSYKNTITTVYLRPRITDFELHTMTLALYIQHMV